MGGKANIGGKVTDASQLDNLDGKKNLIEAANKRRTIRVEIGLVKRLIEIAARIPKSNGKWLGEKGNSIWRPNENYTPTNPKTNPDKLTWKEISEKYNVKEIKFVNNEPDFSPISKGTVDIEDFSLDRDDNFAAADEELAKKRGCTRAEVTRWRKQHKYTWHEKSNCKTLEKVPTVVHGNVPHSGGIAIKKKEIKKKEIKKKREGECK